MKNKFWGINNNEKKLTLNARQDNRDKLTEKEVIL